MSATRGETHSANARISYIMHAHVSVQGRVLMLNERIRNVTDLERALINAERKLKLYDDDVRP